MNALNPEKLATGIRNLNAPTPERYRWSYKGVTFDFYRLCEILGITHQAQAHALKKVIRAGRSIKPVTQDIDETIDALRRWKEMIEEDGMEKAMATQYSNTPVDFYAPCPSCNGFGQNPDCPKCRASTP